MFSLFFQLSYASSVDTLSNQQRFPNFFRTHTSESNLAISIISIMEKFGWKKLKIITQEESLFVQVRHYYFYHYFLWWFIMMGHGCGE